MSPEQLRLAKVILAFVIVFLFGWIVGRIDIPDQVPQEGIVTVVTETPEGESTLEPATLRLLEKYQFLLEACENGEPVGRQGQRQPSSSLNP